MIPRLSPQDTIQKQLKKQIKNIRGVRGKPTARSVNTAKINELITSRGTSSVKYWAKKASTP